jgi:Protein of unknown function (DUF4435)
MRVSTAQVNLSLDEWVSLLSKSNLPTVITEGKDDYSVFRRLESKFTSHGLSFLPVGGRNTVLSLFERRSEFRNTRVLFVVDKDCWVLSGVPQFYISPSVIVSEGYSIENDVYRDGNLERLLDQQEKDTFRSELEIVCNWFSSAYRRILNGETVEIDHHPNRMISWCGTKLKEDFETQFGLGIPDRDLFDLLQNDYAKYLRGKTLMSLIVRQLSSSSRHAKYSKNALLEIGATSNGPMLTLTIQAIEAIMST